MIVRPFIITQLVPNAFVDAFNHRSSDQLVNFRTRKDRYTERVINDN